MKNSDIILYNLLVESGALSKADFYNLQEDTKVNAIRLVASNLLKDITGSLDTIDTTIIDKSRGDIKSLKELEDIQTNLKQQRNLKNTNLKQENNIKRGCIKIIFDISR